MLPELKQGWSEQDGLSGKRPRRHEGLHYYISAYSGRPHATWLINYDPNCPRAKELLSMWVREGTVNFISREKYLAS